MSKFPTVEVNGEQVVYHIVKQPDITHAPGYASRGQRYTAVLMYEDDRGNIYGYGKTFKIAMSNAIKAALPS